jgi:cob(I)alamin adenosyltransferase
MSDEPDEQHRLKMILRKEPHDRKLAAATQEKGLIVVTTWAGKGKTTAALGLVFRTLGHGMKVGVVQFTKGPSPPMRQPWRRGSPRTWTWN